VTFCSAVSGGLPIGGSVGEVPPVEVDSHANTLPEGFSYSAPTMLVLFVFISTFASAANLVETRHLGLYERMSAAAVHPRTIIAGETIRRVLT
jgi:ABC-2 type transport system permease protein